MHRTDMEEKKEWKPGNKAQKLFAGIFIIAVGCILLIDRTVPDIPHWVISWKTLLLAIGFFVGIKNGFKGFGWAIPMLIGGYFIFNDIFPHAHMTVYFWPLAVILVGILFIINATRSKSGGECFESAIEVKSDGDDETLEAVSIFGAVKKNVVSKNFRGGEIVCVFGGAKVDFSQADIEGRVELEVVQVFGGCQLIIPPHWQIKQEATAIFGGIDDKRDMHPELSASDKVIVLKGVAFMGGIEIKSF